MKLARRIIALALGLSFAALPGVALARNPMVGGAPMFANKTIVENASNSKDHKTLVAAIKAAGLVDTLSSATLYTVFAPTDAAFKSLPPGTVDNLLKPENKAQLQAVLTYHVVSGALTTKDLQDKIKEGGGKASIKTIQGESLTVEPKGRSIEITDAKGDTALITIPNVMQSNGVIQVVDTVLLP